MSKKIMLPVAVAALVESTATACLIGLPMKHIIAPQQAGFDDQSPGLVTDAVGQSISRGAGPECSGGACDQASGDDFEAVVVGFELARDDLPWAVA